MFVGSNVKVFLLEIPSKSIELVAFRMALPIFAI